MDTSIDNLFYLVLVDGCIFLGNKICAINSKKDKEQ